MDMICECVIDGGDFILEDNLNFRIPPVNTDAKQ